MPRIGRQLIDGETYHVLTRGNNGQAVFHQDADCQRYLRLLAAHLTEYRLQLYHFALMPNHVHLVVRTTLGRSLSTAMARLNLQYAWHYRKRHGYSGHLWQGRFKSFHIDKESSLLEIGRDVELNPVRAGLATDPAAYTWSSFRVYADGVHNPLITPNPLYDSLGRTVPERRTHYRTFVLDGLRGEPLHGYVERAKRPHDPYGLSAYLTRPALVPHASWRSVPK